MWRINKMKLMIKNRKPKKEYSANDVLMRKVKQLEDKVNSLEVKVEEINNKTIKALLVP